MTSLRTTISSYWAFLLVVSLTSCTGGGPKIPTDYRPFVSVAEGFSIHFPGDWQIDTHPDNPPEEPKVIATKVVSSSDFASINVIHKELDRAYSSKELSESVRTRHVNVRGWEFTGHGLGTIGGKDSWYTNYKYQENGQWLKVRSYEVMNGMHAYVFTATAPFSKFSDYFKTFETIVGTFTFLPE